jgi:hypothetical protein
LLLTIALSDCLDLDLPQCYRNQRISAKKWKIPGMKQYMEEAGGGANKSGGTVFPVYLCIG